MRKRSTILYLRCIIFCVASRASFLPGYPIYEPALMPLRIWRMMSAKAIATEICRSPACLAKASAALTRWFTRIQKPGSNYGSGSKTMSGSWRILRAIFRQNARYWECAATTVFASSRRKRNCICNPISSANASWEIRTPILCRPSLSGSRRLQRVCTANWRVCRTWLRKPMSVKRILYGRRSCIAGVTTAPGVS